MSNTSSSRHMVTIDGNTAAGQVAHALSEVIAIYPITPSSPMGEMADELSAAGEKNIWGTIPLVVEMQSEGGAAGAVHGALTAGALSTTFTASQGLLLMIPNMYKIAGELTSTVFHVAARALAAHALSIYGDHSDVMAARSTGFAFLCSGNVQEAHDLALVAHAATLESRIPFCHFFDGFRTSHEVQKIEELTQDDLRAMIDDNMVRAHRLRGLSPDRPVMRGTAQNPDVYFQGREAVNSFYNATPAIVQKVMDRLAGVVGRQYHLFDYAGAPDADRVVVIMGSGAEATHEVVDYLNARGEKVGIIRVRLYRPFDGEAFVAALPKTVKKIAVMDRTKEPGAQGDPLYLDVVGAINEAVVAGKMSLPITVGGRYGLGSKEFTASMAKAIFDNLAQKSPKNHFTVGIVDDVTGTSLDWDANFSVEGPDVHRALFFGLGADGTVGANKNSIKIIGKATDNYAQGYFYYDSKKSGTVTTSHLRFSKRPIRSTYLLEKAGFVACHNFSFLERVEMLSHLDEGGTFLLNAPYSAEEVWDHLPIEVQKALIEKKAKLYAIDANSLAKAVGLGAHINIIMQAAFFIISGVLPQEQAMEMIMMAIEDTYGRKGGSVVEKNIRAAQLAGERINKIAIPAKATSTTKMREPVPADAPDFIREVTGEMIAFRGDQLPVSKLPVDGTYPVGTTKYEKRNIATEIPVWESAACIQCNQCSFVCPHASIRVKVYAAEYANGKSPDGFKSMDAKGKEWKGLKYTVQVSPEDCTGCGLCVENCPAFVKDEAGQKTERKAINLAPLTDTLRDQENISWNHFLSIPDTDQSLFNPHTVKGSQLLPPMFEFSGACTGCGEAPYIRLMTQLFGDRAIIANATGCTSIYGGNLPTTPYTTRASDGRGPAWSNSLFEDAAEFGLGMRLTTDKMTEYAYELLDRLISSATNHTDLLTAIRDADQSSAEGITAQRDRVAELRKLLAQDDSQLARELGSVADYLTKKSVWIFGGDGWGYDIGYGGLDHVLASGRNVNVLLLDTGVYSNTGGQMSKATPRAAVAKFAAAGKSLPKKDIGMISMTYGNIYVAQIAMGANMNQALKAMVEAEAYDGPSIIIAYSHCIMHGHDMRISLNMQEEAVQGGFWPLYRYNPMSRLEGKNPLSLDSKAPSIDIETFMYKQNRFKILRNADPERAQRLLDALRQDVSTRWKMLEQMSQFDL